MTSLPSTPWGGQVVYRSSTGSTMDDAQALEAQGVPEGSVAWAGFQTAGRGRFPDRVWHSAPGANLLFTVYWNPDRFRVPFFAPSLTVGLGLCFWLESLTLPPSIPIALKWPNDVYLADRKVAGILVRRRLGAAGPGSIHAGVGVNLLPSEPRGDFRSPATSLAEVGCRLSPAQALEGLLPALARALAAPDPRSDCVGRLWRQNQELALVLPDGQTRQGLVRGLDEAGGLLLEGAGGLEVLSSGE